MVFRLVWVQLTVFGFKINQVIGIIALVGAVVFWVYFRFFKTNVHFEAGALEKNMTLKELRQLRVDKRNQKQEDAYNSQFELELDDDAGISEDEYIMKKVFDKIDEDQRKESDDGVSDN